ncbi:MAG: phytanoyl-CoA dioxygenase family protein [Rhizobiaceae bacterium]
MQLSADFFQEQGYATITDCDALKSETDQIKDDIDSLALSYGFSAPFGDSGKSFDVPPGTDRTNFYRSLRYLPSLGRLANSELLCGFSKQLGLEQPIVMNASNIRMDVGGHNPNKFHWHQDYTYLLGSRNSVTYWIPLQDVSQELGGIELVPGSHQFGLSDFSTTNDTVEEKTSHVSPSDIVLKDEPVSGAEAAQLNYGDGLVFSQFLLHRSLEHRHSRVRWTIQVRHSDAMEPFYREHGCPMGDTTTILRQAELSQALRK